MTFHSSANLSTRKFGRFAEENRKRRGEGKPETFDFLGFKHISGKNRLGRFSVRRLTIRKRMRRQCPHCRQTKNFPEAHLYKQLADGAQRVL